jgi:ribose-phosphate pyrophosphokinase
MNIEIYKGNEKLDYKRFTFPAGEVGIKLNITPKYQWIHKAPVKIVARIQNSEDLVALSMVKDAIERADNEIESFELYLLYLPYGRQDRVCDKGESFSLKVFADYINFLKFDKVFLFDPHSDVAGAVFNNVIIYSQLDIINKFEAFRNRANGSGKYFISPDAGANKKTSALAKYYNHKTFIRADKLRDLSNGNILETIVYCDDLKGADCIIADDLCDGGRTFIELAKSLKAKNCGKIVLYVTHGIFSKGIETLFENGIDEIYTTDSYPKDEDEGIQCEDFHRLDLVNAFVWEYDQKKTISVEELTEANQTV